MIDADKNAPGARRRVRQSFAPFHLARWSGKSGQLGLDRPVKELLEKRTAGGEHRGRLRSMEENDES